MRANKYIRGAQAAVVSILAFPLAVLHAQPNRIVSAVDMSRTVVLRGHVHPSAHPRYDLGAVEPSLELGYVTLLLKQSPDQQAALEQLLADQQDPSSPRYHQWLSPEQYGDRFGLSGGDTAQVVSWLRSQGLTVKHVARGHNWIA